MARETPITLLIRSVGCVALYCSGLLTMPLVAQTQSTGASQWKTFRYFDDGFSVSFPSAPGVLKEDVPAADPHSVYKRFC